jgi:hypothetical protein
MELGSYFLFLQEQIKDIISIIIGLSVGLVSLDYSGKREPCEGAELVGILVAENHPSCVYV